MENTKQGQEVDLEQKKKYLEQVQLELAIIQQEELKHRLNSSKETFSVISEIKTSLKNTLKESQSSQSIVKWMFGITFGLGVLLILMAIYFAFQEKEFLSIAFGTLGLLDIIAHLIAKPPLQLQDARSNYTQLTVAVLTWFNDFIDKSAFMVDYQTFARKIVSKDPLTSEKMKLREDSLEKAISLSEKQFENTIKMLHTIEVLAEPSSKIKDKVSISKKQE